MKEIFKKKTKAETVVASAPEEPETPEEIQEIQKLSGGETVQEVEPSQDLNYREVPVCMSQSQINNLVIENNIMLKQIISEMD